MQRLVLGFSLVAILLPGPSVVAAEGVTFRQAETAILENALVRVEFDLAAGTYRAIDKRDGSSGFRDGCIQVDNWTSTQEGHDLPRLGSARHRLSGHGPNAGGRMHQAGPADLVAGDYAVRRQEFSRTPRRDGQHHEAVAAQSRNFIP